MIAGAVALALLLASPPPARADETLAAPGIAVAYPAGRRRAAEEVAGGVPAIRAELSARLGVGVPEPIRVELAEDLDDLLSRVEPDPEPWAAGVAIPRENRIVLRLDSVAPRRSATLLQCLRHEMVHLGFASLRARRPLWFEDGVAQWFAGWVVLGGSADLDLALQLDRLLPLSTIETRFPSDEHGAALAYLQSESLVRHLVNRFSELALERIVGSLREGRDLKDAILEACGEPLVGVEVSWRDELRRQGSPFVIFLRSLPLFSLVALLLLAGFVRARLLRRRMLRGMSAEEEGDRAAEISSEADRGEPPSRE